MSTDYENTLLVKQKNVENVLSELKRNSHTYNIIQVYGNDEYELITFDSKGNIFQYGPEETPNFEYEIYENMCLNYPEDGVEVESTNSRFNDRISNLVLQDIIFPSLHINEKEDILRCLQYTPELIQSSY